MKSFFLLILIAVSPVALSQNFQVSGDIIDEEGQSLPSAVAVLLNPSDSTFLYFGMSNNAGKFEIKNIKPGDYLLQVSLLGFNTVYSKIKVPDGSGPGTLVMVRKVFNMGGVEVTGERIPIRIKKDTLEYNAKAFAVKPDGVAEDLIKKLPGIEVDRSGNIKAMGEDVENVLVDGKEFFGNDPKVATRNLPADAISKVQLFDRQSDESQFTGIDDGERNPTLNFVLEEGKKSGVFGDVSAGAGTGDHGLVSGKVYRFTRKNQLAGLGMMNNINQFGFSLNDYISFNGGISALAAGDGHVTLGGENSFPVNFGQPVYGKGSNGAAGLNFSVSGAGNNRFFASFLGSGSKRNIDESTTTRYFVPDGSFLTSEERNQTKRDSSGRLNFGLRKTIGTRQNLIVNGAFSLNSNSTRLLSDQVSIKSDLPVNEMSRDLNDLASGITGNADASWLLRMNQSKTILKLSARTSYSERRSDSRFKNSVVYYDPVGNENSDQFYNLQSGNITLSSSVSITQRLSKKTFGDISLTGSSASESLDRQQGIYSAGLVPDAALSPGFKKTETFLRPGITWKFASEKSQISIGLLATAGEYNTKLNDYDGYKTDYFRFTPRVSWEYDIRSGRRVTFDYMSSVIAPSASQLLPVINNVNTMVLVFGNRELRPEYIHNARFSWWLFDQFSFTTLLSGVTLRYTGDKIGYSRNTDSDLRQVINLINSDYEWTAGADIDFSTAIKPLGMKINIAVNESFSRGTGIINGTDNNTANNVHRLSLTLENRKKDKWDIQTGSAFTITDSRFSVNNSLNNVYTDVSWFSEASYTPGKWLNIRGTADITNYSSKSFDESILIPVVGAEVNYYFSANQRAVITLSGIDLLNRNTGLERMGELNYLVEKQSWMIGRYFMLSFKYRLNKTGGGNGIDIQVKRR